MNYVRLQCSVKFSSNSTKRCGLNIDRHFLSVDIHVLELQIALINVAQHNTASPWPPCRNSIDTANSFNCKLYMLWQSRFLLQYHVF